MEKGSPKSLSNVWPLFRGFGGLYYAKLRWNMPKTKKAHISVWPNARKRCFDKLVLIWLLLNYLLPSLHWSCCIIFLHPVPKDPCTHFMYMHLLGASLYDVNKHIKYTGAITCHNSGETEEVLTILSIRPCELFQIVFETFSRFD